MQVNRSRRCVCYMLDLFLSVLKSLYIKVQLFSHSLGVVLGMTQSFYKIAATGT